jgi:hypothetical protein
MKAATFPSNDRGETSIQVVLLVPIILSVFFTCVHAASLAHGGQVASLAAMRGAQISAASNGSSVSNALMRSEIQRSVREMGNRLESEPQLSVFQGNVQVTVRVQVPGVVPFLPTSVRRSVTVPLERFIEEQDRQ